MFNYNFVFFYASEDIDKVILGLEVYKHPQVRVYDFAFNGSFLRKKIFHLHMAYRINKRIDLPLKSIWFKSMYEQNFCNDLSKCFVFLGGNMVRYEGGFICYVHNRNPLNRVVVQHWDLISKKIDYDYNIIKNKVDLAITYDRAEARKYGIHYFQETTYSKLVEVPSNSIIKQDVYFLGAAKDRLDKIFAVYKYLTTHGVKCKFMIAGVPMEKRISGNGLEYITGISYDENIRNVIESKCILEVIQGGSSDITLRVKEAIAYGRRLITNCPAEIKEYFNPTQLIQFDEISDIDTKIAKASLPEDGFPPKLDMNPLKRLYDIQEQLEKLNG